MSNKGVFLTVLDTTLVDHDNHRLNAEFAYVTSDGQIISVPKGFVTDFASVPRFLPIMYALCGNKVHEAAVIHDYLYRMTDTDRSRCDWIFRDAMEAEKQPAWRRWIMWAGVRVGGWWAREKVDGVVDGKPVTAE